jgi:spermidine synthase
MKKIISLLFFLSGLAGLIYEVVWAKHLALFLGNTSHAHTIVLATFMGGLALGYYFFGKTADEIKSALNLYGWLEIGVALCGLFFTPLLGILGSIYISLIGGFGFDSTVADGLKFGLSIALLLPPTVLMGGTLPVLSRFVVRSLGEVESQVGWLYFINSLGAIFGSLLAGFILIPNLGLNLSMITAVALNLFAGLTALALRPLEKAQKATETKSISADSVPAVYTERQIWIAIVGITLSGGAALMYEIAWIRLLSLVLGASTYSFSLMLAAFIAGIALGSFLITRKKLSNLDPYNLFALSELGVAVSIVLTLPLYEQLPYDFMVLSNMWARTLGTFWLYELTKFLLCFLLMLLPTTFLGMTLPLVSQIGVRSFRDVGKNIGRIFAANTAGTLIGAVAAGLALLPLLGIKRLIELGVVINLIVGVTALLASSSRSLRRKLYIGIPCAALFVFYLSIFPSWDQAMISSGAFRLHGIVSMNYGQFKTQHHDPILYYKDGSNMTVTVSEGVNKELTLRVNGKPDASSYGDLPTQILLAQIPMLLQPAARNVLVIGLGSGITAGSVLRHPVDTVDLVELSPEVVQANVLFAPYNHHLLEDPKLKLHIEDGKTFLKTVRKQYDVVISEPSNPWIAGVGNLFSVEFYEDVKKRLAPTGVMVQWFHTYEMTDDTLRLLLRTFAASFEHVTVWNALAADIVLIGSQAPLNFDAAKSEERFETPEVKHELGRLGIETFRTILALQAMSDANVRKAAGKGSLNEDVFPILEYEAPKAFFLGQRSSLLAEYDERRQASKSSSYYFLRTVREKPLTVREIKDIATYYLKHSSPELARAFVALWLRQSPNDPDAWWALARLEANRGNRQVALQELARLMKAHPDGREYLELAAKLETEEYFDNRSMINPGSPERALAHLGRLVELETDGKDKILEKMAEIHATGGDFAFAAGYLEKAASYAEAKKAYGDAARLWMEASDIATRSNNSKAAELYVRRALAADPSNPLAKAKLKQLQS